MIKSGIRSPMEMSDTCVKASDRLTAASRRLKAAEAELHAAEVELRLASEAMDKAEADYYGRLPPSASDGGAAQ